MDMMFTEAEEAFRQEVRDFLEKELPPDWNGMTKEEFFSDEGWAFYKEFTRKLAAKGWLQMHWPVEYGGQAASPMKMTVFVEEMAYNGAPVVPEANWIGPAIIIHYATGATALVTSCPWCGRNFRDAMEEYGERIEIYDIAEVACKAISE